MRVEWKHSRCVVCLGNSELSVEHVIPESLGGILTGRILCRNCNSSFGAGFEANARLSPELRKAASALDQDLSELKERLERGAKYKGEFGELSAEQKIGKDGVLSAIKLKDGSLIVPEDAAPKIIASMLQKRGVSADQVETALAKWETAPGDCQIDLGAGIEIRKWQDHPATPTYTETPLSPLVPLKIAYEFAALMIGGSIYQPAFQHLREVLMNMDEAAAARWVTYNWADKAGAYHGIAFEGNHDSARFQVRLLGLLAYTVRFPRIGIEHPLLVYTHRIDTQEECVQLPD